MAVAKKTRGRIWENQETLLSLQKWGDESIQMKLISSTRKRLIWQEISDFIRAAGYDILNLTLRSLMLTCSG